jgi:transposase-like protein
MTRSYYSPELTKEVAEFFLKNGRKATLEKWPDIPVGTMYTWYTNLKENNLENKRKQKSYSDEFKAIVAEFFDKNGIKSTAEKWPDLSKSTIYSWSLEKKNKNKKKKINPDYSKVEIPEKPLIKNPPPPPEKKENKNKKIYVVYSEDADAIIDVLKGLK